jgi:hypothetical protein
VPKSGYGNLSVKDETLRKIDKLARQDPGEPSRAQVITKLVNEKLVVEA